MCYIARPRFNVPSERRCDSRQSLYIDLVIYHLEKLIKLTVRSKLAIAESVLTKLSIAESVLTISELAITELLSVAELAIAESVLSRLSVAPVRSWLGRTTESVTKAAVAEAAVAKRLGDA